MVAGVPSFFLTPLPFAVFPVPAGLLFPEGLLTLCGLTAVPACENWDRIG